MASLLVSRVFDPAVSRVVNRVAGLRLNRVVSQAAGLLLSRQVIRAGNLLCSRAASLVQLRVVSRLVFLRVFLRASLLVRQAVSRVVSRAGNRAVSLLVHQVVIRVANRVVNRVQFRAGNLPGALLLVRQENRVVSLRLCRVVSPQVIRARSLQVCRVVSRVFSLAASPRDNLRVFRLRDRAGFPAASQPDRLLEHRLVSRQDSLPLYRPVVRRRCPQRWARTWFLASLSARLVVRCLLT